MKANKLSLALGLALASTAVQAAGPLYLFEGGSQPTPYKWDTSNGPIPVWTDGGGAFTYDFDGVTPFITIERANEITQLAFDNWNNVATSTFEANIAGTIESQTGIADVTGANADQFYGQENGYGFWVSYDTDGSILEDIFGMPKTAVLGIAFPEWADESTGEIVEAQALVNGWYVTDQDVDGNMVAGVFTHEFGHAINLSHTQVNGQMAYFSYTYAPKYPGVRGCVDPLFRTDYPVFYGLDLMDAQLIETMFPFIDHTASAGENQSTVEQRDDIVAISNLYPTADYASSTGSISGVLRLKDGATEYSGINVIARNVADPLQDAVSNLAGSSTQGLVGPDGRFTLNGLTPGAEYVVYIEQIVAGGYPTTPMPIVSQAEYWNEAESNDPAMDDVCDATPIVAEAGETKIADIIFNGYTDGIQYTPIVSAHLTDLAKNGKVSAGLGGNTAFTWDENHEFRILPPEIKANNGMMNRNGQKMTVQYDFDGNGIAEAALFDFHGQSKKGKLIRLGTLGDGTCGGSSSNGVNSTSGWDVDSAGHTVVGLAYVDQDGDGICQSSFKGEIVPFIWTHAEGNNGGIRELPSEGLGFNPQFVRAHAISGNGRVILGAAASSTAVAWVDEGDIINLRAMFNGREAYASNYAGDRIAVDTWDNEVILWNPYSGETQSIGGLAWCVDMPYTDWFGRDYCGLYGAEFIQEALGPIPVLPFDMNDEGSVIIGRAGSFRTGFIGAIWIEGMGWMNMADFLYKQGVAEAFDFPMDNPISIDGSGDTLVGGLAGATFAWHVDMKEVFVCQDGADKSVSFPGGLMNKLADGAEFGRCAFID